MAAEPAYRDPRRRASPAVAAAGPTDTATTPRSTQTSPSVRGARHPATERTRAAREGHRPLGCSSPRQGVLEDLPARPIRRLQLSRTLLVPIPRREANILNAPGGQGTPGATTAGGFYSGGGGASGAGYPGPPPAGSNSNGIDAVSPGAGGGGACSGASGPALHSGVGAAGLVIVEEYIL